MKYLFSIILLMLLFSGVSNAQKNKTGDKMLRHVVLFKFKDDSSPADIKKSRGCIQGTAFKNKGGQRLRMGNQ